jgi:predicted nucleic acid-binding protein
MADPLDFIDTNVFLRHLLGDHPQHSPRATALIARIEQGELQLQVSEMVIFETVFTLERSYRIAKDQIRDSMLALLSLPGLIVSGKRRYRQVFDFYVDRNLPFGDAYIIAQMQQAKAGMIYSFDTELDRKVPEVSFPPPPNSGHPRVSTKPGAVHHRINLRAC